MPSWCSRTHGIRTCSGTIRRQFGDKMQTKREIANGQSFASKRVSLSTFWTRKPKFEVFRQTCSGTITGQFGDKMQTLETKRNRNAKACNRLLVEQKILLVKILKIWKMFFTILYFLQHVILEQCKGVYWVDLGDSFSNEYFIAKSGFDTAENEPCKVCPLTLCGE